MFPTAAGHPSLPPGSRCLHAIRLDDVRRGRPSVHLSGCPVFPEPSVDAASCVASDRQPRRSRSEQDVTARVASGRSRCRAVINSSSRRPLRRCPPWGGGGESGAFHHGPVEGGGTGIAHRHQMMDVVLLRCFGAPDGLRSRFDANARPAGGSSGQLSGTLASHDKQAATTRPQGPSPTCLGASRIHATSGAVTDLASSLTPLRVFEAYVRWSSNPT